MRWAVFFFGYLTAGCFNADMCHGDACAPPRTDACEGVCAPFVSGLWTPVLVVTARSSQQCPDAAPLEAMATATVIACGVQEADGECSSDELICLRSEPGWTACIVRDGAHACPVFYEAQVQGEDGVTLCCPSEEPPA